jgi:cytochrome b
MSQAGKKSYGRVWDPLVRLFHWVLVGAFATAWFERSEASIHQTAGKVVLVLIILRTAWGLIGPASARFDTFVKGPVTTFKYVSSIFRGNPAHYLGHNPAGAAMIGALLLSLVTTAASGVLMTTTAFWGGEWIEWIHGTAANLTVLLIAGHLLGVIAACFQHRENLPLAMVTGRKMVSVNTERFLGPTMFTKRRLLAAAFIAASASAAWAGSSTLFNAGVWRMPKTIIAEARKAGCDVSGVAGPRIVVYPVLQLQYDVGLAGSDHAPVAAIPVRTALERRPKIDIANVAADCQVIAGQKFTETLGAPLVRAAALFASVFPGGPTAPGPAGQAAPQDAGTPAADGAGGRAAAADLPVIYAPSRPAAVSGPEAGQGPEAPVQNKQAAAPRKKSAANLKPSATDKAKPAKRKATKKPQRKSELKAAKKISFAARAKGTKLVVKRRIKRVRDNFSTDSNSSRGSSGNSGSGSDNSGSGSNNRGSGSDNSGSGSHNSGSGGGGGDD